MDTATEWNGDNVVHAVQESLLQARKDFSMFNQLFSVALGGLLLSSATAAVFVTETTNATSGTVIVQDAEQAKRDWAKGNALYAEKRYAEALAVYRRLAEMGEINAAYNIGLMYQQGRGTEVNCQEAAKWYQIAARHGQAEAQGNLAFLYQAGNGVEKNPTLAAEWAGKSARQGNASGQYLFGAMTYNGDAVANNRIDGAAWLQLAGEQKHKAALETLQSIRTRLSEEQWQQVDQRVAELKRELQEAMITTYPGLTGTTTNGEPGMNVVVNMEEIKREWAKAADLYNNRQYAEAFPKIQRLARNGHVEAAYFAGLMCHRGRGTAVNYAEAVRWYRFAAEQNNASAQCNLGVLYRDGSGLEKNLTLAAQWFEKSARQGNAAGQLELGVAFINGTGRARLPVEGMAWMILAAEQGEPIAKQNMEANTRERTPEELRKAKERAAALKLEVREEEVATVVIQPAT